MSSALRYVSSVHSVFTMPEHCQVTFCENDTVHSVCRETVGTLKAVLGLESDEQVVQYALAKLRDQTLPRYPEDAGEVPEQMIDHIRSTEDQTSPLTMRSI